MTDDHVEMLKELLAGYADDDGFERSGFTMERAALKAAIAALLAQPAGSGGVVVPREMTFDMEVAFCETWFSKKRCIDDAEMQDAYAAMLAAAPASPQGWMPIESAPRDGMYFLASTSRGHVGLTSWDAGFGRFTRLNISSEAQITHWQPLPAPPSSGDGRGVAK